MRIYVATKWEEAPRAREVMFALVERGHSITHDWTVCTQEGPVTAANDVYGVVQADAVVFVAEKDLKYTGALVEVGVALGLGKPVYVLGNAPVTDTLFFKHPLVQKVVNIYGIPR